MKLILLVLPLLFFMLSCESATENEGSAEKGEKEIYLEKGQVFIESQINKDGQVLSLLDISIDSIASLSTQGLEYVKMQPYLEETQRQAAYMQDLMDNDAVNDIENNDITHSATSKYVEMNDSIQRWSQSAQQLISLDTVGYSVKFLCKIVMSDYSVLKDQPVYVHFDTRKEIPTDWNPMFK